MDKKTHLGGLPAVVETKTDDPVDPKAPLTTQKTKEQPKPVNE
jgi:hypothetical protein